jgi:hypothetical protein
LIEAITEAIKKPLLYNSRNKTNNLINNKEENKMHVELKKSPEVSALLRHASGEYNSQRAVIEAFHGPMELSSNWSGGSKTWYTLVDLADGRVLPLGDSGAIGQARAPVLDALPLNAALIETSCYQGKWMPAHIHMHPDNITKFLADVPTLTVLERATLGIVARLKSSYREEEAMRFGMSRETFTTIKARLAELGFLTKAGAITVAGRNAL